MVLMPSRFTVERRAGTSADAFPFDAVDERGSAVLSAARIRA
jgi:hypothetical protein